MTLDQLKNVMKFQLKNFNDEGVDINDETVHNTVLSNEDGFGDMAGSAQIYQLAIRMTLRRQGHEDKQWPVDWMDVNVQTLAPKLL